MSEPSSHAPILLRPLLSLRKHDLQEYLKSKTQLWVEDPSNQSDNFERVKIRKWLAMAPDISRENLYVTQKNIARSKDFINEFTQKKAQDIFNEMPGGSEVQINRAALLELHDEISLRLLARLCNYFGQTQYKPRLRSLERVLECLNSQEGGISLDKTHFKIGPNRLRIYSEPQYLPKPSHTKEWHNYICQYPLEDGWQIGAFGEHAKQNDGWRNWDICTKSAMGLPAIYSNEKLLFAPNQFEYTHGSIFDF